MVLSGQLENIFLTISFGLTLLTLVYSLKYGSVCLYILSVVNVYNCGKLLCGIARRDQLFVEKKFRFDSY